MRELELLIPNSMACIVGLPGTGRTTLIRRLESQLREMGESTVLIDASSVASLELKTLLEDIVVNDDWLSFRTRFRIALGEGQWIYLLIDDLDDYLLSKEWELLDSLLGQVCQLRESRVVIWATATPRYFRSRLESMSFSDRANLVPIGDLLNFEGLSADELGFGGWASVKALLEAGDHAGSIRRAKSSILRIVSSLPLFGLHELRMVGVRHGEGRPKSWGGSRSLRQLVPLITLAGRQQERSICLSPEFEPHFRPMAFLDELGNGPYLTSPIWRARWFMARLGRETDSLWWDGWFGGTGNIAETMRPSSFLIEIQKLMGVDQKLRILCNSKVVREELDRFREIVALINAGCLPSIEIRTVTGASSMGLHDRNLFLKQSREIISLPIYSRLVGPAPPGDYSETREVDYEQFRRTHKIVEDAWSVARPVLESV